MECRVIQRLNRKKVDESREFKYLKEIPKQLTGFEENDSAETSVLGSVDVHLLELCYRFLESFDFTEKA